MEINSSQEILFSSQNYCNEENNDLYPLSTQEINNNKTQEALNATQFLDTLEIKSSQESVINENLKTSSQLFII